MAYTLKYTLIDNDTHYEVTGYTGTPISVTIPATYKGKSVTSIGNYAFYNCANLTSITIPNSVTSIGISAFNNTGIYKNEDNWENGVLYIDNWLIKAKDTISGAYTIKEGTVGIAGCAFEDCTSLTSIEIPNSVTSIGSGAFRDCSSLTSIEIPNSVTGIGSNAFYVCSSLTTVTIGNSVTSIGSDAFAHCARLTSIEIPNSVTSIGNSAFYKCTSLTSVTIGSSVTNIGDGTFSNCNSLTSIEIPNSVTSIGSSAFSSCDSLQYNREGNLKYLGNSTNLYLYLVGATSIDIASATINSNCKFIGSYAFEDCTSLTSITIPNSVTSIGSGAFYKCTSLTSIIIPEGVTSIDTSVFSRCTSLTSVTIPNSVTYIDQLAFSRCTNLTSVTIPNSVTSIGHSAFSRCTSLTSVTIGNSVTSILHQAFDNCTNLNSINMISKVPANLVSNSFTNIKSTAKFYCYSSALESYRTATNWSSYKDKFVADDIRLTFINSANAQKSYFASKDEIKTLQNKADIIEINKKLDTLGNIFNYDEYTGTLTINPIVWD